MKHLNIFCCALVAIFSLCNASEQQPNIIKLAVGGGLAEEELRNFDLNEERNCVDNYCFCEHPSCLYVRCGRHPVECGGIHVANASFGWVAPTLTKTILTAATDGECTKNLWFPPCTDCSNDCCFLTAAWSSTTCYFFSAFSIVGLIAKGCLDTKKKAVKPHQESTALLPIEEN